MEAAAAVLADQQADEMEVIKAAEVTVQAAFGGDSTAMAGIQQAIAGDSNLNPWAAHFCMTRRSA